MKLGPGWWPYTKFNIKKKVFFSCSSRDWNTTKACDFSAGPVNCPGSCYFLIITPHCITKLNWQTQTSFNSLEYWSLIGTHNKNVINLLLLLVKKTSEKWTCVDSLFVRFRSCNNFSGPAILWNFPPSLNPSVLVSITPSHPFGLRINFILNFIAVLP